MRRVCRRAASPSEKAPAMGRAACAEDGDGRRFRKPLECDGSARVAELVDAPDLGSGALGRVGSSPTLRTMRHRGRVRGGCGAKQQDDRRVLAKAEDRRVLSGDRCVRDGPGQRKKELRSQLSYSVNRKFLWMWAYEKTGDGTLYLNVALDHREEFPGIHRVTQVGARRWDHHVVVKSLETANSSWLQELIRKGFEFSCR